MEYINLNVSDITYLAELIRQSSLADLIRANNLRRPPTADFRKLCAH